MRPFEIRHVEEGNRDAKTARGYGRQGFSLVESMVVLAITGVLTAMTFQAIIRLTDLSQQIHAGTEARNEAVALAEHLAPQLMSVGGGPVRPWSAILVENNPDGDGSDRIRAAFTGDSRQQATLLSFDGVSAALDATEGCVLSDTFLHREVILTTGEADGRSHWTSRRIETVDPGTCRVTTENGQLLAAQSLPTSSADWTGGSLAVVNVSTYSVDPTEDLLLLEEDRDHNGELEVSVLADRVVDLQAALGYDVYPWDWQATDMKSTADEWLYNAPGDTFGKADGQGLAKAQRDDLRLLRLGITVGGPIEHFPGRQPIALLDGPARARQGWILRSFTSVVSFRNLDIMR